MSDYNRRYRPGAELPFQNPNNFSKITLSTREIQDVIRDHLRSKGQIVTDIGEFLIERNGVTETVEPKIVCILANSISPIH